MYETDDFPPDWTEAFIHFIKKPDEKSYRPVSLTSCVCKLFESLVKSRLQWWCEHHNLLPNSQAGFRKGQWCHDNLVNLLLHIEDGFASHRDTLAAFFRCRRSVRQCDQ